MSGTFTHLHTHSHYSLLDGGCRVPELVKAVKAKGMDSVAITDHGAMFGVIEFYAECVKHGVKPIIGIEAYMAPGHRSERSGRTEEKSAYHLLLLAQNQEGYRNLMKLSSIAYREGFYYKPRIDKEVLAEYGKGLICTSACLGGEVASALMRKSMAKARQIAETYLEIFGPDRFFIELQEQGIREQELVNPELADLARRLGVGVVATNDVHFLNKEDHFAHDVLCCISMGRRAKDEGRLKYPMALYLKSPEEMAATSLPREALDNTGLIAGMCELQLDFSKRYAPKYPVPASVRRDDTMAADERYIRQLCEEGLEWRYGTREVAPEVRARMEHELGIIASKNFCSYFLIVWDFCNYARRNGIPVGARGSGVGTMVGYLLGLCNVDPLRYHLLFERFMDPSRNEMPDLDIDICQDGRQKVIEYVRQKYGHVAQIITFGTLAAKNAFKDVARVMGLPLVVADEFTRLIPPKPGTTLAQAIAEVAELRAKVEESADIQRVVETATKLEGTCRNAGCHAAGLVIADQPLDGLVPLYEDREGTVMTQFEGPIVEKCGLLKMDFLGLRTLSVLTLACELVKKTSGKAIDIEAIDYGDQKVLALFRRGQTRGVFQFESGGMQDLLMKMRPDRIEDLIVANALYRPGPMALVPNYCARKHGQEEVPQVHPVFDSILAGTYGIMVFQEDVMRIFNQLGGIELASAYKLIKAISKKQDDVIARFKPAFVAGCGKHGLNEAQANAIFALIEPFASYGFNKCVAGSTRLWRTGNNKGKSHPTIADMYRIRHNLAYAKAVGRISLRCKYMREGYGVTLSMNAKGALIFNKIVDIRYEGVDTVYSITTASGRSIRCNARHRFPTPSGTKRADELAAGDKLYVQLPFQKKSWYTPGGMYGGPRNLPRRGQVGFQVLGPTPSKQWREIKRSLREAAAPCDICGQPHRRLEIHHRDGNYLNAVIANAQPLCPSCHKKEHYRMGRTKAGRKGLPIGTEEIVSITDDGQEDVYDVEMAAPNHTFVTSEGIVTCNSHATRYSIIAFQTAYMKVYHPVEYMTALLTYESGDMEKLAEYMDDCRRMKIAVLPPDINASDMIFTPAGGSIRFGLSAIRGVGEHVCRHIMANRAEHGPYISLLDFCERVDDRKLTKATIQALIKAGAFTTVSPNRAQLLACVGNARDEGQQRQKDKRIGQGSLFDMSEEAAPALLPDVPEMPLAEILRHERELLGFYVTSHPLQVCQAELAAFTTATTQTAKTLHSGSMVTIGGMLVRIKTCVTKRGKAAGRAMAIVTIEDGEGQIDVAIFSEPYDQCEGCRVLRDDAIVFVKGRVERRRATPSLIADEVIVAERAVEKMASSVVLRMAPGKIDPITATTIRTLLEQFPGPTPAYLSVSAGTGSLVICLDVRVSLRPALQEQLKRHLGNESVQFAGARRKARREEID